ncbi:MAG: class I SAM-dependent methyltransferase [Ruminiclostridium sp.]|nr:class I SAM-dependent methyltransferase [Ruminiclostridium sp.]
MFLCPSCKKEMNLPECSCGYKIKRKSNVWQLSDMPDIVKDGDGDKYIGYEEIGEEYSGNRKYIIEEENAILAAEISALTGDGVFLDLACGDGCFTVPCAANGTHVIAGDISNRMLSILQRKALHNGVSLENVTLCRMNALNIPLSNECVDVAVANSVLHLISNPEKVISEIYRVLKPDGAFMCFDDTPGKQETEAFDNTRYFEIVNSLYAEYWKRLGTYGIIPSKYSWHFDRSAFCNALFRTKMEKRIFRNGTYELPLCDVFLPRFCGRGFSDQTNVPKDVHDRVIDQLMEEFRKKYGDDFAATPFRGIYDDIMITIYTK